MRVGVTSPLSSRALGAVAGLQDGRTPLHAAAVKGDPTIIRLLLANGAKGVVNFKDKTGTTALHDAARHGGEETVAMILESGANIKATNKARVGDSQDHRHCFRPCREPYHLTSGGWEGAKW